MPILKALQFIELIKYTAKYGYKTEYTFNVKSLLLTSRHQM